MFVGGVDARERGSAAYCAQDHIVAGVEDPSAWFCSLVRMVRGWGGGGGARNMQCETAAVLYEQIDVTRTCLCSGCSGYCLPGRLRILAGVQQGTK